MSHVYFVKCGAAIKIGIANNVKKRISNLQTSASRPVSLLGSAAGDFHAERKLHQKLDAHRLSGEWFRDNEFVRSAMLEFLETGEASDPSPPALRAKNKFGAVAKAIWPHKTAAHLATIAGANERTATRWLSGESEPPNCIVLAVMQQIFGK